MNEVNLVKNLNLLNVSNQQLSISDNLVVNAALDGKVHCVDFASRFEKASTADAGHALSVAAHSHMV